jgi:hypothetical protein
MELKRSTTAFEGGKSGDDVHTLIARGSRGDLHFPQKKESKTADDILGASF